MFSQFPDQTISVNPRETRRAIIPCADFGLHLKLPDELQLDGDHCPHPKYHHVHTLLLALAHPRKSSYYSYYPCWFIGKIPLKVFFVKGEFEQNTSLYRYDKIGCSFCVKFLQIGWFSPIYCFSGLPDRHWPKDSLQTAPRFPNPQNLPIDFFGFT